MSTRYKTGVHKGIKEEIKSVKEAVADWQKNQMGLGEILILRKDVDSAYSEFNEGFAIESLHIGGLPSEPGRTTIVRAVSINEVEKSKLSDMNDKGVSITIHIIPEEPKLSFEQMVKKFEG